jgi:PAS domain S-box-containing protein
MHEAQRLVRGYGLSLGITALAFLFTLFFWSLSQRLPFALCLGAVLICTFMRGPTWGLTTTLLSAAVLVAAYVYFPISTPADLPADFLARLAMFLIIGSLATYLSVVCRRALASLDGLNGLLTSTGEALIIADKKSQVAYLNPNAQTLTQRGVDEARGLSLGQVVSLIDEKTRQPVEIPVAQVVREATGMDLGDGLLMVTPTDKEIPVEGTLAPTRNSDDEPDGVALSLRSIAKWREVEKQLRENVRAIQDKLDEARSRLEQEVQAREEAEIEQERLEESSRQGQADLRRQLKEQADAHAEMVERLRATIADLEQQTVEQGRARSAAEEALRQARVDSAHRLREETEARHAAEAALRASNTEWQHRLEEKGQALARAEDALRASRVQLDQFSPERWHEHQKMAEGLQKECTDLHRQLSEHLAARAHAEDALRLARAEYDQRLAEQNSMHQLDKNHLHAACDDLRRQLSERSAAHRETQQALDDLRCQLAERSHAHGESQRVLDDLRRQLAEHSAAHGESQESLRQAQMAFQRDREEQEGAHANLVESLRQEIVHRSLSEESLRDMREHLEAVMRQHADPMFAFDPAGRVTVWNPAMEKVSGASWQDAIGRPIADLLSRLGQKTAHQTLAEVLQGKNVTQPFETPASAGREAARWQAEFQPVSSPQGAARGGMATLRMLALPVEDAGLSLVREDAAEIADNYRSPHRIGRPEDANWLSFN